MNVVISEVSSNIMAKVCTDNDRSRKVTYTFVDAYHSICIDKKDILSSQLEACERLFKYSKDEGDKKVIEKEITELKMTLDLMPNFLRPSTELLTYYEQRHSN
jgi:UTP:GlnB (protein PII) uridylyltransferase